MTVSIQVPDNYGYVILGCGILPTVANLVMSASVMKARKEFNVKYPNLYAVPGYHDKADEFNRVQRGHQNYLEVMSGMSFVVLSLIGGLANPITMAVGGVAHSIGSILYLKGYADTSLDVESARYKKGALIKQFGFLASVILSVKFAGQLQGWW